MISKTTFLAALGLSLTASIPAFAQSAADIRRGQTVAREVCSECHAVENMLAPSPNPDAPSFRAIAERPEMNAAGIYSAIRTPHYDMPTLIPDRADVDSVIAYIVSLQRRE